MKRKHLLSIHPGRIILEESSLLAASASSASQKKSASRRAESMKIVQGQRSISADIAHRLAHYFGMSERYWLDLQARYVASEKRNCTKSF